MASQTWVLKNEIIFINIGKCLYGAFDQFYTLELSKHDRNSQQLLSYISFLSYFEDDKKGYRNWF